MTASGLAFVGGRDFPIDSEHVFPNGISVSGDEGTISFCLQPQWNGNEGADASFVGLSAPDTAGNQLQIATSGQDLRFTVGDSTGTESSTAAKVTDWHAGERHLVTATWGQQQTWLYVDGQLADQRALQGRFQVSPDTPLLVGSNSAGDAPPARGSLTDLQVYSRPLGAGEIATLAAGCR